MRNFEVKELARKLGLEVPERGEDADILAHIARQIGFDDFFNTEEDIERLYSALKDVEHRQFMNDFWSKPESKDEVEVLDDIVDNNPYNQNTQISDNNQNKENQDEDSNNLEKNKNENEQDKNNKDENNNKDNQAKQDESEKQLPSVGNGYGATQNSVVNAHGINDSTKYANNNLKHNQKVAQGKKSEETSTSSNTKQEQNTQSKEDTKAKTTNQSKVNNAKIKGQNALSKASKAKEAVTNPVGLAKGALKKKVISIIMANPIILVFIGFLLMFLLILFVVLGSSANNSSANGGAGVGANCSYSLSGVTSSKVDLDNVKVELLSCDSKSDATMKVLETVDFEKYVLGVALAEIGEAPDEAFKTQIIAARNFALTRNKTMCPGRPDNCMYGYNPNTNTIRMRACEADQVYWDYTKEMYRNQQHLYGQNISFYSPDIRAKSGSVWKSKLSEEKVAYYEKLANEVKGQVLVNSNGNVVATDFVNTNQQRWIALANQGKKYEEILKDDYGSSKFNSATCTSSGGGTGNIDYGDYVLSTEGLNILHQPLDSFLSSKGSSIDELNSLIKSNVEKAGYGTRAGVVAAAVTLVGEMSNKYNYKLPYYWGGGHGGISNGAASNWGSTQCRTHANGQWYNYCGLDCSGFVAWAISNGGFKLTGGVPKARYYSSQLPNSKVVSLNSSQVLQPGDLMFNLKHVVLIVGIDEKSKQYILAEASGNKEGIKFSKTPFNSSSRYQGLDLSNFYVSSNVK